MKYLVWCIFGTVAHALVAATIGCASVAPWQPTSGSSQPAPSAARGNSRAAAAPGDASRDGPARGAVRGQNAAYPYPTTGAAGPATGAANRQQPWRSPPAAPGYGYLPANGVTPQTAVNPPPNQFVAPGPPGPVTSGPSAAPQRQFPQGPTTTYQPAPPPQTPPPNALPGAGAPLSPQGTVLPPPPGTPPVGAELGLPPNFADIDVLVEEARTGRFMFGVGVNSSAGVVGQIVLDERNFDLFRVPTSWRDFTDGTAFRGAGQGFRLEALPGNEVQRYLFSFTEPYLLDTPVSLSLSGFFFNRNFFDWDEQRFGGRVALGYRLTHDLSLSVGVRTEEVEVSDPRVTTEPELNRVLGDNEVFSGQVTLTHDTRDMPFAPTEGHLIELSYQQVFGTFDYPRGDVEYRRHHLIFERPDGSGRHTFSYGVRAGFSGTQTPIYDRYFAGGFSTLRGFDFRGASPVGNGGVIVGGEFQFLGSVEYLLPLTADDMIKGVVFCDFGTVEEDVRFDADTFRVAPGFGLRVNVPAMGPAPLAFDFAFPVSSAATDDEEVFSFFIGFGRL